MSTLKSVSGVEKLSMPFDGDTIAENVEMCSEDLAEVHTTMLQASKMNVLESVIPELISNIIERKRRQ